MNILKRYFVQTAEIILVSHSPKKLFEHYSGFRNRYLRGGFWILYDSYESTRWKTFEEFGICIRDQQHHYKVQVIADYQK